MSKSNSQPRPMIEYGFQSNSAIYFEKKCMVNVTKFIDHRALTTQICWNNNEEIKAYLIVDPRERNNLDKVIKVEKAVNYIYDNYHSQIKMKELSESLNMDNSNFSRHFRASTGLTFTNFVNQIRINKACQLLKETDKYISTICYGVGYNSVANFNRRFLEQKQVTPTEYRLMRKPRLD